ncbi:hypothetical protein ebA5334 [Aromatoleum aromaticum EbN1]|uniref:Uncharacterized protein n=1 Tax=Aromatoleum aromaticum (strain DSM 19018 / LMG 30748 / EbN1) TaxID=76114 RepID=Q5P0K6_AROAE|nr:hypothetical protein ebA5334 [Aromatoleum aromaticum EbN1]
MRKSLADDWPERARRTFASPRARFLIYLSGSRLCREEKT